MIHARLTILYEIKITSGDSINLIHERIILKISRIHTGTFRTGN